VVYIDLDYLAACLDADFHNRDIALAASNFLVNTEIEGDMDPFLDRHHAVALNREAVDQAHPDMVAEASLGVAFDFRPAFVVH
jgi:hypothetical protein